jgi:exopolyphosphatase/pppGpp-phosphohydrolase
VPGFDNLIIAPLANRRLPFDPSLSFFFRLFRGTCILTHDELNGVTYTSGTFGANQSGSSCTHEYNSIGNLTKKCDTVFEYNHAMDMWRQVRLFHDKTITERKKILGLEPKRADVIIASACLIERIMIFFPTEEVIVGNEGVRCGLLYEQLDRLK